MPIGFLILAAGVVLAPPAATWRVSGTPGAVTTIIAQVKTGGRIVADGFVPDAEQVAEERATFPGTTAPSGSCAKAAAARPFTRLRRFAASGRLLWEWRVKSEEQALRLHAAGGGDCLSPDGGRLTVAIYRMASGEPVARLGEGVVAVDHRPRFVEARGARSHSVYGGSHDTGLVGWRRGRPATLMFEVERGQGEPMVDEVALNAVR